MGYVREEMIIVHGFQAAEAAQLHEKALGLFGDLCGPMLLSKVNSEYTFFVAGCGSKIGWADADRHDERIAEFMAAAEALDHYLRVITVSSGESDGDFGAKRWRHTDAAGWCDR